MVTKARASVETDDGLAAAGDAPLAGMRILYVDDEPMQLRAVKRLLGSNGATCFVAGDYAGAIEVAATEPLLGLAILDFHMPDGDVGALIAQLRRSRPGLQVIGTSGRDVRTEFALRGVEHFLAKPWSLEELVRLPHTPGAARASVWSQPS